jgi:hypothetical protein
MSSWAAETYPWLVIVNSPVLSNEPVPTTQYAAPLSISFPELKRLVDLGRQGAPQLAVTLRDLGHVVGVRIDAAFGTGCWRGLPVPRHGGAALASQRNRPVFCGDSERDPAGAKPLQTVLALTLRVQESPTITSYTSDAN